jgi:hypothetical protein
MNRETALLRSGCGGLMPRCRLACRLANAWLIGLGAGRRVARVGQSAGMKVIA